jgi:enterochelin esterase-like enzyme
MLVGFRGKLHLPIVHVARTPPARAAPPRDTASTAAAPLNPGAETAAGSSGDQSLFSPARVEQRFFYSAALNRTMPYLVYLPPGYDSAPSARFPVLYMLHGLGGNYTDWQSYGTFTEAERLMSSGQCAPFLIVLLEGDDGYWVDHADAGPRWGSYVAVDAVQEIDLHFRTLADRGHRGIGGNSMGAHGALQLALNYPDAFGSVGAHSPALRTHDQAMAYFGDETYFAAHDPIHLVRARPDIARSLVIWLDVGTLDGWSPAVERFHQELSQEQVLHVWHEYPGDHSGIYWSAHVDDYLLFESNALR